MKIEFIKCHGSENDFVLIDLITNNHRFDEKHLKDIVINLCDRNGPVGADGVLYLLRSNIADARMRIFNADASEAEMCGNGIRCIGRLAGYIFEKKEASIETLKATILVKENEDLFKGVKSYSANLQKISLNLESNYLPNLSTNFILNKQIPELSNYMAFTAINMGNPHLVAYTNEIDSKTLNSIGNNANRLKHIFPFGINVTFYKKINNEALLTETFERGVGITNSCGTAMAGTSVVAGINEHIKFNTRIEIYNKGGVVKCKPSISMDDYVVSLEGNATFCYSGSVKINEDNFTISGYKVKTKYEAETSAYRLYKGFVTKKLSKLSSH
ncbi:MAG: diaminopimelate epimerase [Bacteroidales bacterium]|nr:diaminopimelate epimerase [Bacteroidales bacterium]